MVLFNLRNVCSLEGLNHVHWQIRVFLGEPVNILLISRWISNLPHLEVRNFDVLSRINPWRIPLKSITISASVHNHNAQTKRTQHKSIVKLLYKGRWQHLLINLQHRKPLHVMCSERHFHDMSFHGFLSWWPFGYVPSVEQANNCL